MEEKKEKGFHRFLICPLSVISVLSVVKIPLRLSCITTEEDSEFLTTDNTDNTDGRKERKRVFIVSSSAPYP